MAIHIEWGSSDHTVLIWRAASEMSLEDYLAAAKHTTHLLKTVSTLRTIVIDVRQCHHTAHNLIPVMREQIRYLQTFQGEFIVLSKTQFWQGVYHVAARSSIGLKLPNIRFHVTQDETVDILATL
jgi:hypothetical protein